MANSGVVPFYKNWKIQELFKLHHDGAKYAGENFDDIIKGEPISNFNLEILNRNPNAIGFLKENPEYIHFEYLLKNPNPEVNDLLEELLKKLQENGDYAKYIRHMCLCHNEKVLAHLEQYPDDIDWDFLSSNTSPYAIRILEKNLDKVNWQYLSYNSSALHILKANYEKIIWETACSNPNPEIIKMFPVGLFDNGPNRDNYISAVCANPNALSIISWQLDNIKCNSKREMNKEACRNMSLNPNAMRILIRHKEFVDQEYVIDNPNFLFCTKSAILYYILDNFDHFIENLKCVPFLQMLWDRGRISEDKLVDLVKKFCTYHVIESVYDVQTSA